MRRVACVSTVVDAEQQTGNSSSRVIDIFNSSRIYNLDNQITGAFIVSGSYLLMIVEGEATTLANLVFKFRQDERLKDFSLIQNVEIEKADFTSWGIKSLKEGQIQSRFYEKLKRIFSTDLDLKSRQDEQRLDVFIGTPPETHPAVGKTKDAGSGTKLLSVARAKYEGETLSLSGWPKPGKIKLCPELIKVCARLVGKPQHYHALLNANIVENEEALLVYLRQLNRLGILRRHDDESLTQINTEKVNKKPQTPDRFGSVLRNFLTAARR